MFQGSSPTERTSLTLNLLEEFDLGDSNDIDGNFPFHTISKMKANKGKPIDLTTEEMALLFIQTNSPWFRICFTVVVDGDVCHNFKRASWERRKDTSLLKINRMPYPKL